jgi:hypothetical protein
MIDGQGGGNASGKIRLGNHFDVMQMETHVVRPKRARKVLAISGCDVDCLYLASNDCLESVIHFCQLFCGPFCIDFAATTKQKSQKRATALVCAHSAIHGGI